MSTSLFQQATVKNCILTGRNHEQDQEDTGALLLMEDNTQKINVPDEDGCPIVLRNNANRAA